MQPLVNRMAAKLPTWKSQLMQKPGRLPLSSLCLDQSQSTSYLCWHHQRRPSGSWRKSREDYSGKDPSMSTVGAALPTSLGGLGVKDLEGTGLAVRVRWQGLGHTDNIRAWSGLDLQLTTEERDFFFPILPWHLGKGWHPQTQTQTKNCRWRFGCQPLGSGHSWHNRGAWIRTWSSGTWSSTPAYPWTTTNSSC
jgi:hypothetical protein